MKLSNLFLASVVSCLAGISFAQEQATLSVKPLSLAKGEDGQIEVVLNTSTDLNSLSFDVEVPAGLKVKTSFHPVLGNQVSYNTNLEYKDYYSITTSLHTQSLGYVIYTQYQTLKMANGTTFSIDVTAEDNYSGTPGLNHVSCTYGKTFVALKYRVGTVGKGGYSSYSNSKNSVILKGATPYYAKVEYDEEGAVVTLTETEVIRGEQGLVLKGKEGADIIGMTLEDAALPVNNELKPSLRGETVENAYVLTTEGKVTGFYKYSGYVPASKAYLKLQNDNPSKVRIRIEDATGIHEVESEDLNGVIFNLNGQKVNEIKKGIHIVNGKKVMF